MFLHCLKTSVSDGFGIFFPFDNSHMDTACPDLVHRASLILPFLLYILKLLLGLTFSFLLNGWSWNSFISGFPVQHVLSEAQPSPSCFHLVSTVHGSVHFLFPAPSVYSGCLKTARYCLAFVSVLSPSPSSSPSPGPCLWWRVSGESQS